jgi:hypothetical protein
VTTGSRPEVSGGAVVWSWIFLDEKARTTSTGMEQWVTWEDQNFEQADTTDDSDWHADRQITIACRRGVRGCVADRACFYASSRTSSKRYGRMKGVGVYRPLRTPATIRSRQTAGDFGPTAALASRIYSQQRNGAEHRALVLRKPTSFSYKDQCNSPFSATDVLPWAPIIWFFSRVRKRNVSRLLDSTRATTRDPWSVMANTTP